MAALNAKEFLINSLNLQHRRLVKDLQALPPETHGASFAGCARSPLYMLAEVAWMNGWIADVLQDRHANRLTGDEEEALFGSVTTAEQAIAMLDESVSKLKDAYASLDENALGDITEKPFGRPAPLYNCAYLPISHMIYHDGQLNYAQALHGDGQIHW